MNFWQAQKSGWQLLPSVGTWLTTKLDAEAEMEEFWSLLSDSITALVGRQADEPKKVGWDKSLDNRIIPFKLLFSP